MVDQGHRTNSTSGMDPSLSKLFSAPASCILYHPISGTYLCSLSHNMLGKVKATARTKNVKDEYIGTDKSVPPGSKTHHTCHNR